MDDPRRARLTADAAAFRLELLPERAAALLGYLEALLKRNEEINLTAVRDLDEALTRHAADSFAFGLHLAATDGPPPRRLLDFGSGGGFPGVPLAAALPATEVVLLDGTRKKVDVVRELCANAGFTNVRPLWARAEDLVRTRSRDLLGACDAVTARAVGPLAEIVARAGPFVRHRGALICWKSAALSDEERRAAEDVARGLGLLPEPDLPYATDRPSLLVRYRRRS